MEATEDVVADDRRWYGAELFDAVALAIFRAFPAPFFLVCAAPLVSAAEIRGIVRDELGVPISAAIVRVQATEQESMTDEHGRFVLGVERREDVVLTAWKAGFLNGASEVESVNAESDADVVVVLKRVPPGDAPDYRWVSPNFPTLLQRADIVLRHALVTVTGDDALESRFARNCSNCHADSIVTQWRADAHSRAARNPIVASMYNGTDAAGRRDVFPGYRLDFPNSPGNCANCHAPVHALASDGGGDLNDVSGIAAEGIFCDFCHKVSDVELHADGAFPGVSSMKLNRPSEGRQVFYGPYDDAVAGPDAFSPVYRDSRFCAGCHNASFWGVPIYSEYEEWSRSPYSKQGVQCQDCHMAPDGRTAYVAPPEKGAVRRDPQTISTHTFRGPRDTRFMAEAIALALSASVHEGIVEVKADVTNVGAGHHVPTGVPMRNLILLLDVTDANGESLDRLDGPVVPEWGGQGSSEQGNYAGLPGKGFAKVLADAPRNFPNPNRDRRSPTPHWRQAVIISDTRIPAKETDISRYRFRSARGLKGPITVSARLIYRRSFKPWIDAKGWPLEDLEFARTETTLSR